MNCIDAPAQYAQFSVVERISHPNPNSGRDGRIVSELSGIRPLVFLIDNFGFCNGAVHWWRSRSSSTRVYVSVYV